MKNLNLVLYVLLVWLCSSCSKDETVDLTTYQWIPSPSSNGSFRVMQLKEQSGELYALASQQDQLVNGVFKLSNNEWVLVKQFPDNTYPSSSSEFTVIGDIVYFSAFRELFKLTEFGSEKIMEGGYIKNLSEFQGKLIIVGDKLNVGGTLYSMVVYDGVTLIGLAEGSVNGEVFTNNNKVYVSGLPGLKYDGKHLSSINFYGSFLEVDDQGSLYYGYTETNRTEVLKLQRFRNKQRIGNSIPFLISFYEFEFFENRPIAIGKDNNTKLSVAYFLRENLWQEIPGTIKISNAIAFENRLFAIGEQDQLIELIRE
jgi:hypothetical protein